MGVAFWVSMAIRCQVLTRPFGLVDFKGALLKLGFKGKPTHWEKRTRAHGRLLSSPSCQAAGPAAPLDGLGDGFVTPCRGGPVVSRSRAHFPPRFGKWEPERTAANPRRNLFVSQSLLAEAAHLARFVMKPRRFSHAFCMPICFLPCPKSQEGQPKSSWEA